MKKQLSLLALFTAVCMASSCSRDNLRIIPDGRTALTVTSGIQTRAYDKTWDANDAIGIYMLNSATVEATNQKYITSAGGETGTFAPITIDQTIYLPVDGTTRDFVAYYPHATIGADNLYVVNVSDQTTQKNIDLMGSEKVTGKSKTDAAVAFVFTHKLSKVVITLKGDGTSITDAELAGTVVKITSQQTAATYNVVSGGDVSVTSGVTAEVALLTNGLKAEGIVLPNTDTKDMLLTFTVPALSQTFEWAIKDAPKSQLFEAGKKYLYTITIAKAGITVTSTVVDWLPGNGEDGETGEAA